MTRPAPCTNGRPHKGRPLYFGDMKPVTSAAELEQILGRPEPRVANKARSTLHAVDREWLAAASLAFMATSDAEEPGARRHPAHQRARDDRERRAILRPRSLRFSTVPEVLEGNEPVTGVPFENLRERVTSRARLSRTRHEQRGHRRGRCCRFPRGRRSSPASSWAAPSRSAAAVQGAAARPPRNASCRAPA